MWSRILGKIQTTVFGGALVVSTSWMVSKLLGLVKLRLINTTFGPGGADSIFAAFAIPDLIYGTLVLGSLLSAFMPVFMESWQKDKAEAWRISRSVLNFLALAFLIFGLFLLFGASPIVKLLVGRNFGAEHQILTTQLLQLLSMNMLMFSLSNVFAGVLQSFKRFLAVSVAPIIYNLGIIAGILCLAPKYGAAGVAYGAIAGAFLHLLVQFSAAWRVGWRFGPVSSWRHPQVKKIGRLILPRTIGQSITQIDQFVNVPIATRIGVGQLAIFRMANDVQDAPVNIVGLSMATVAFPVFVELLAQGKKEEFIAHFSKIVRQVLFVIIPLTILIIQLRAQIVRIFFGASNVSWAVTIATAQTLGFFALSFVAQSLIPILARSFYAMHDTKTPVKITIVAVVLDIIGSIVLGFTMGVQGLALSYSISNLVNAVALTVILHHRVGHLDEAKIIGSTIKIVAVTVMMAISVQGMKLLLDTFGVDLHYFAGVFAQAVVAGLTGVAAYIVFAMLFNLEAAVMLQNGIKRMWQNIRYRNGSASA